MSVTLCVFVCLCLTGSVSVCLFSGQTDGPRIRRRERGGEEEEEEEEMERRMFVCVSLFLFMSVSVFLSLFRVTYSSNRCLESKNTSHGLISHEHLSRKRL